MIDVIQGIGALLAAAAVFLLADVERNGTEARLRLIITLCLMALGGSDIAAVMDGPDLPYDVREIFRAVLYWSIAVLCVMRLVEVIRERGVWRQWRADR